MTRNTASRPTSQTRAIGTQVIAVKAERALGVACRLSTAAAAAPRRPDPAASARAAAADRRVGASAPATAMTADRPKNDRLPRAAQWRAARPRRPRRRTPRRSRRGRGNGGRWRRASARDGCHHAGGETGRGPAPGREAQNRGRAKDGGPSFQPSGADRSDDPGRGDGRPRHEHGHGPGRPPRWTRCRRAPAPAVPSSRLPAGGNARASTAAWSRSKPLASPAPTRPDKPPVAARRASPPATGSSAGTAGRIAGRWRWPRSSGVVPNQHQSAPWIGSDSCRWQTRPAT